MMKPRIKDSVAFLARILEHFSHLSIKTVFEALVEIVSTQELSRIPTIHTCMLMSILIDNAPVSVLI